jgi:hypothetical protein
MTTIPRRQGNNKIIVVLLLHLPIFEALHTFVFDSTMCLLIIFSNMFPDYQRSTPSPQSIPEPSGGNIFCFSNHENICAP